MIDKDALLKFMAGWEKWESKVDFYVFSGQFIASLSKSNRAMFIGIPIEGSKKTSYMRELWKTNGTEFDRKFFKPLIKKITEENSYLRYTKPDGKIGYVYNLSQHDTQAFLGIFEIDRFIDDLELEQLFFSYLHNGFSFLITLTDKNKLLNLAFTDDVTGFFNQRKLIKDINTLIRSYKQNEVSFSVLFVDIDHFKKVNDSHGHLVGSSLLCKLAQNMQKTLRQDDLLYRYGGDEFVLLLPQTDHEVAQKVGNRIIENIKKSTFVFEDKVEFRLSVSIGIAEYPADATDTPGILKIADKMMYEAKNQGRGRVCNAREILGNIQNDKSESI